MKENIEFNSINNNNKVNIKIELEHKNENNSNELSGNKEFILCLQKALKKALDENEKVKILSFIIFLLYRPKKRL